MRKITKLAWDGLEQYFEIYTRRDLPRVIRYAFEAARETEGADIDYAMYWTLYGGTSGSLPHDWNLPPPRTDMIKNLYVDHGGHSVGLFGNYELVYDEEYGDWWPVEVEPIRRNPRRRR